jgi:transcriptional regulator with XRE-family HTH domain
MRFGAVLRHEREAKRETLRAAARRIGCSHVYLSEIESGAKRPSPEKVIALADAYGLPVDAALRSAMNERLAAIRAEFTAHMGLR